MRWMRSGLFGGGRNECVFALELFYLYDEFYGITYWPHTEFLATS
jgi:hypothetical protein